MFYFHKSLRLEKFSIMFFSCALEMHKRGAPCKCFVLEDSLLSLTSSLKIYIRFEHDMLYENYKI